jgi:hypothetical protein
MFRTSFSTLPAQDEPFAADPRGERNEGALKKGQSAER